MSFRACLLVIASTNNRFIIALVAGNRQRDPDVCQGDLRRFQAVCAAQRRAGGRHAVRQRTRWLSQYRPQGQAHDGTGEYMCIYTRL